MTTDIEQPHPPERANDTLYPQPVDATAKPKGLPKGVLALQFLIGGMGGFSLVWAYENLLAGHSLPVLAGVLVLAVVMVWLQVLVHEAGHAVAGLLVGRKLIGAGVGPLRLESGVGGWQLRWGGGVAGIGGFAAMLPAGEGRESRRHMAAFLLGGPLANLVFAVVAIALLATVVPLGPVATAGLGGTAFGGLLFGIVNLIPFRSHGWHTDGFGLRELWRNSPAAYVARNQQDVLALAMAGVRPRDWPAGKLEVPVGIDEQMAVGVHTLRLSWALDRDDWPAARSTALALADGYPRLADGQRQGIAVMMASYGARTGDAALLAAWRPLCEGGLLDTAPFRFWLDAEAAVLAGDSTAAGALSMQARAAMGRIHDRASVVVMGEYLDRLDSGLAAAG